MAESKLRRRWRVLVVFRVRAVLGKPSSPIQTVGCGSDGKREGDDAEEPGSPLSELP
jgi:hypothetical protein